MCEMDYKGGGGLRDMTERDALLAARDQLARTARRLWRPTRPQLPTARKLPPAPTSKFGSKGAPPPLGYFETRAVSASFREVPRKTGGQGVPLGDSAESTESRLDWPLPT
jgi:hypothetical protein